MCKTHSTYTYTNINSTESLFISLIFSHTQLGFKYIYTKAVGRNVIVTLLFPPSYSPFLLLFYLEKRKYYKH